MMSLNAAVIEVLLAKGLTGEDMLEVARAIEVCVPRSAAAERQARYRERKSVTSNATGNVTPVPKEKTQTLISDPDGSVGEPTDPLKELFDVGVSVLTAVGHNERQARSLIGKWRQGRSDGEVLAALVDCRTKAISNPVEWMPKRLNGGRQRDHADIVLEEASRRRVA
jgi:hypothetical protein